VGTDRGLHVTTIAHATPTPFPTATPRPEEAMIISLRHSVSASEDELTYTIWYRNRYPEVANQVAITNCVPVEVTLVPDSKATTTVGAGDRIALEWQLGDIAAGEAGSVGYRVSLQPTPTPNRTVPAPTPRIVNEGAHINWRLDGHSYAAVSNVDVYPSSAILLPLVKR